jgi:hypothetical protein
MRAGSSRRLRGGVFQAMPDGGFVWAAAFRSVDAGAVRLHITDIDLRRRRPPFSHHGRTGLRPVLEKGPNDDGDFWTDTTSAGHDLLRATTATARPV